MYYTYYQNNSGGSFDVDETRGISVFVIVEADSAEEADALAEDIGVYFDPEYNFDCECCGTRWDSAYGEGDQEPSIYGEPALGYAGSWKWVNGPEGYIHHRDGRIEPVFENKEEEKA